MSITESYITQNNPDAKIIGVKDEAIITSPVPVFMHDALGTIITVVDPIKPLQSDEEKAIYILSSLKAFNPENEAILDRTISNLQMTDIVGDIKKMLESRKLSHEAEFFALADIITEEYCKKIGDPNQDTRVDVLLKTHALAIPGIFDNVNEYSQRTFHSPVSQLVLTQDNPIMKRVYQEMLGKLGYHNLSVISVPDKRFEKLRKSNPRLYSLLASYFEKSPNDLGLYDDSQKNITAASEAGILTQLATGIQNGNVNPMIIERETEDLVKRLFENYGRSFNGSFER